MTREQKLALIIGFSLVMVVGVLISDHFSRARTDTLGSAVDQREGGGGSRIDPISLVADEPPLDEAWIRDPLPDRSQTSPPQAAAAQPEPPVAIVMGEAPAQDPLAPSQGADTLDPYTHLAGPPLSQQTLVSTSSAAMRPGVDGGSLPQVADPLSEMFEPVYAANAGPTRTSPQPQPTLVRDRTHTVAEDESLWKIAERHYGDGSKWTKIRDRNPELVSKEGEVQAGVKLAIPLEGIAPVEPGNTRPAGDKPAADEDKPALKPRTYVVRKGDSLGEIAQRELGSARRWPEIVKLNDIEDPDDVPAGLALRLPS